MNAYAVAFQLTAKEVFIIPDEIYFEEDMAQKTATQRGNLTKPEPEIGKYVVVPVVITGECPCNNCDEQECV